MTKQTRLAKQARKAKLIADIYAFHQKMSKLDPESIMTSEECAECRRLIREGKEVGLTEGEHLRAIHVGPSQPSPQAEADKP